MSKITRQGSNKILSSAVEYHNFVFLAGMTADDLSQDITGQTRQVLDQIDALLSAAGSGRERILRAEIFLPDMGDFPAMNAVWERWVPQTCSSNWSRPCLQEAGWNSRISFLNSIRSARRRILAMPARRRTDARSTFSTWSGVLPTAVSIPWCCRAF